MPDIDFENYLELDFNFGFEMDLDSLPPFSDNMESSLPHDAFVRLLHLDLFDRSDSL